MNLRLKSFARVLAFHCVAGGALLLSSAGVGP